METNNIWLSKDETMEDVKKYFMDDPTIENFIFPKYFPVYKRAVSYSMCKALIYLYKWHKINGFDKWCKLSDYISTFGEKVVVCSGDNPKLRHFGLTEMKSEIDGEVREDGSSRTGYYKITPLGIEFLSKQVNIPKYVFICNKEVLKFSTETHSIENAIKNKFDYQEIFNK